MKHVIEELQSLVNEFTEKISGIPDDEFSAKPLPHKWSKKEVVGHLIDSAQNNLRRFICSQYEATPPKIIYEQDFWVTVNGYQSADRQDVLLLWKLVNERICAVLANTPEANYSKPTDTGKDGARFHALQWLAEDYVKHMKHHLNQIIPRSFNVIYT
ncbi:MAG: DinB family protein [Cyclobacteriaceae bacterium]|nr:DinB family protein [Cyclobacteriaceae bacterium]